MLLFLVPLVVALLAMLLGGRPEKLAALPFRAIWLALIAFGVQWIVVRIPGTDPVPLLGGAVVASCGGCVRSCASADATRASDPQSTARNEVVRMQNRIPRE